MQMYRQVQIKLDDFTDHIFTNKNLIKYCKDMLGEEKEGNKKLSTNENFAKKESTKKAESNNNVSKFYSPKQNDSLFWCFYILKHGYSNYEMEINGQYFVIEKQTKLKYVEQLKKFKDAFKLHKIKPFSEIEDDLANKDKISIKTFFALCIMENINVLLVEKKKIYQLLCSDSFMRVVHRDTTSGEYSIEPDLNLEKIKHYLCEYYMMPSYDVGVKSMASYSVDELIALLKKIDVKLEEGKKMSKKDYYELLVQNF
jgi:hypothetical protein